MLTDVPPRKSHSGFLEIDRIRALDLPKNEDLLDSAKRLETAMKADNIRRVRSACTEFLATASKFYEVPNCGVKVLPETSTHARARDV